MTAEHASRRPLSGEQVRITFGDYAADIASVGASLRTLTYRGRDLVVPFDADVLRPVFRGSVLVPWPNRVAAGHYSFDGTAHRIPINEPERSTALHGLAVWADWTVVEKTADSVTLEHRITAQEAYPFDLLVAASYRLGDDGLRWSVRATNLGAVRAPYGVGSHAYLVGGAGRVNDWTLSLPARQVLEVSADRLLPLATRPVGDYLDAELDFRVSRGLGETFVDHAYTDLTPRSGGENTCRVEVRGPGGTGVAMTWDPRVLPWVQVHTADRPEPELNRAGLAVEPMSCPPDAFNSGVDLVVLDPGASHEASWLVSALDGQGA